jgi:hypothetical protein
VTDPNRPVFGEPNAPCRSCGAPLAADQRYCLQCGTRRAEARLPFLEILARQVPAGAPRAASSTTTVTTATPGGGSWFGRLSTNAAAVAGVACLLLALGIGVLIGGLGSDDASGKGAAAPQIITVGGGAVAPAAATSAAPAATESAPADTETAADDGASKSSKKKSASDAESTSTSKPPADVKALENSSGTDYQKKSEKLPKQVGTGGKAPPKDTSGTAIGGGSDVEAIG